MFNYILVSFRVLMFNYFPLVLLVFKKGFNNHELDLLNIEI